MSTVIDTFRRILLTNLNVINIINNFTGTEQINAAKISGLVAGTSDASKAGIATNVSATFGAEVTFATPYSVIQDLEGDYYVDAKGTVGSMNVDVVVQKSASGFIMIPQSDGATIRWYVHPYTA